jgi:hypothetical protein
MRATRDDLTQNVRGDGFKYPLPISNCMSARVEAPFTAADFH